MNGAQIDWMVIHSSAISHNGEPIAFSMSRGLAEKNQPEIAIYGVNSEDAQIIVNRAAERLLRGELPLDIPVLGFANAPVIIKQVSLEQSVHRFGGTQIMPARNMLQVVIPDPNNRFPWEAGFDAQYRWLQLELYK